MTEAKQDKRADLRQRLIDAAEAAIRAKGLSGLKARDVTAQAGCALGALYTAFDDLDLLVLHVNSRTLARLGNELHAAADLVGDDPETRLKALAAAYVDFALANRTLWAALFDHRLPEGVELPDWHRQEHATLIEAIIAPLSRLLPDLDQAGLVKRARTIFTATHGVVSMALQDRFVATPRGALQDEVAGLVGALCKGYRK